MSGKSLLVKLQTRGWRTPDFSDLRMRREILLFVYDSLKKDTWENTKYLQGAKYLGKAQTLSSFFCMKTGVDMPVVFSEQVTAHACIRGEAYLVSPQHILVLDDIQQNNHYTSRKLEKIILLEQQKSKALEKTGHHFLNHRWSLGFMYIADKTAFKGASLISRGTRKSIVQVDAITGRPYYEWDTWEADWPMTHLNNRGNEFLF